MAITIDIEGVPRHALVDLEAWARFTIEEWQFKISEYDLISHDHDSQSEEATPKQLIDSFTYHVSVNSNNHTGAIEFAFNYYLKMLDMGVRKSHDLSDPARVPYKSKVYSKPLYHQMYRLSELLAKQYALGGAAMIINEFMHGTDQKTSIKVTE